MFLETKKVCRLYPNGSSQFYAVDHIDLSVDQGEICLILGQSGSGKSTLLNMIGGLDEISDGKVIVDGLDVSAMNEKERNEYRRSYVGFVFQFYNLIKNLRVRDNIEVCARLSGSPLDIDELMRTVGIYDQRDKYPSQLSGGQQQRTAIARAIAKNPKLLLCDEPTGALDSATSKQVLDLIKSVNRKFGTTVLLITHNSSLSEMADQVITICDGKKV